MWTGAVSIVVAMLLALLSGVPAQAAECRGETLDIAGVHRTYRLVAPAASGPVPLVVALHGNQQSGCDLARYTRWEEVARANGFAIVFPDAIDRRWALLPPAVLNDIAFVSALVDKLVTDGVADPARVYVTGLSGGGVTTYLLVCLRADLFAAAAPAIAGVIEPALRACAPSRPVPLLIMNGTADPVIPYNGGHGRGPTANIDLVAAERNVRHWRRINGCAPAGGTETRLPDLDSTDKSTVTVLAAPCPPGRDVVLYRIQGGGHQFPRRPGNTGGVVEQWLGPQNRDIDGAAETWSFFSRFVHDHH